MIEKLKNEDSVTINMFGKEKKVIVFSAGDNQYDEEGEYKPDGFDLSEEEIECLNWFIENININDYKKEITAYCNEQYSIMGFGDEKITEDDLENELLISSIAINISEIEDDSEADYPEIAFYGSCECDMEHGICIGFRDKKFMGVGPQDWIL